MRKVAHSFLGLFLLAATVLGCGWLPGPKYPPADPPLVDEPAKTLDIGCATEEAGAGNAMRE